MRPKTNRRRFSREKKEQLVMIQALREQLRELDPLVPVHREAEARALIDLLEEHSDRILSGGSVSKDRKALAIVRVVGAFRLSIQREAAGEDNDD